MNLGEIIATRKLYLENDERKEVTVLIGTPQQFHDSNDYFCPYQIIGIGAERIKYAGGVDSIQALSLALEMIGAELTVLNKAHNGKLRWDAGETGNLGFPVPK